jgi:hypothetical protein
VRKPDGWLRAARERCERLGRTAGDTGVIADLNESIE